MKPPNRILKFLVVLVFTSLIAGFIAYRSGFFDTFISGMGSPAQTGENSVANTTSLPAADTFPSRKTILSNDRSRTDSVGKLISLKAPKTILSSSKSMILADESLWLDSSLLKPLPRLSDYILTDSGPVKKTRVFPKNSLSDSITNRKYEEPLDILPGSKSGPLIRPRKKTDTLRKLQP